MVRNEFLKRVVSLVAGFFVGREVVDVEKQRMILHQQCINEFCEEFSNQMVLYDNVYFTVSGKPSVYDIAFRKQRKALEEEIFRKFGIPELYW